MRSIRWTEEREQIIELLYRVQVDHDGTVLCSVAEGFGPWSERAIDRARKLNWMRRKGSPRKLIITPDGSEALSHALTDRQVPETGGTIPDTLVGTRTTLPRLETLDHFGGELNTKDIAAVFKAVKAESYESEYKPHQPGFPGLMVHAVTPAYADGSNHPFSEKNSTQTDTLVSIW